MSTAIWSLEAPANQSMTSGDIITCSLVGIWSILSTLNTATFAGVITGVPSTAQVRWTMIGTGLQFTTTGGVVNKTFTRSQLASYNLTASYSWRNVSLRVEVVNKPTQTFVIPALTISVSATETTIPPVDQAHTKYYQFTGKPTTSTLQYNTNYAFTCCVMSNGGLVTDYNGYGLLRLSDYPSFTARELKEWLPNTTSTATSIPVKFTNGVVNVTVRIAADGVGNTPGADNIPAGTELSLSMDQVNSDVYGDDGVGLFTPSAGGGTDLTRRLIFSTQPSQVNLLATALTTQPVVTLITTTGGTDTTTGGSVVLQLLKDNDENPDVGTLLNPGSTATAAVQLTPGVSLSSGVATFSGLKLAKPGAFKWKATMAGATAAVSSVFWVTGDTAPGDTPALRQNVYRDSTVWRKTTGVSGPTFATPTATELKYVNGDMATTNKVTVDGFRMTFPYYMQIKRVIIKVKLSSISSTPVMRLYTSQDTTTPTDGTWTNTKSYTPRSTEARITWDFPVTTISKGLWVSQDKNGGASSCDWYTIQVFGNYINPDIEIQDTRTAKPVNDEYYVSIPKPITPLSGAQTVRRTFLVKNNTSSDKALIIINEPARSSGDTKIDTDNVTLYDETGSVLGDTFVVLANSARLLQVQYTITAADNDGSSKHYVRFTFAENPGTPTALAYSYWMSTSSTNGIFDKALDGSYAVSTSIGGGKIKDFAHDSQRGVFLGMSVPSVTSSTTLNFAALTYNQNDGVNAPNFSSITNITSAYDYTKVAIRDNNLIITRQGSATVQLLSGVYTASVSVPASNMASFVLTTQTSGDKFCCGAEPGYVYIANGSSGSVTVYKYTSSGAASGSFSIASWLGARTLLGMWYDSIHNYIFFVTAVSGGSRKIAWYNGSTFVQVGNVTNSDQAGLECGGGFTSTTGYFLMFGARYLYSYASLTYSGGSQVFDAGAPPSGTLNVGPCFPVPY